MNDIYIEELREIRERIYHETKGSVTKKGNLSQQISDCFAPNGGCIR